MYIKETFTPNQHSGGAIIVTPISGSNDGHVIMFAPFRQIQKSSLWMRLNPTETAAIVWQVRVRWSGLNTSIMTDNILFEPEQWSPNVWRYLDKPDGNSSHYRILMISFIIRIPNAYSEGSLNISHVESVCEAHKHCFDIGYNLHSHPITAQRIEYMGDLIEATINFPSDNLPSKHAVPEGTVGLLAKRYLIYPEEYAGGKPLPRVPIAWLSGETTGGIEYPPKNVWKFKGYNLSDPTVVTIDSPTVESKEEGLEHISQNYPADTYSPGDIIKIASYYGGVSGYDCFEVVEEGTYVYERITEESIDVVFPEEGVLKLFGAIRRAYVHGETLTEHITLVTSFNELALIRTPVIRASIGMTSAIFSTHSSISFNVRLRSNTPRTYKIKIIKDGVDQSDTESFEVTEYPSQDFAVSLTPITSNITTQLVWSADDFATTNVITNFLYVPLDEGSLTYQLLTPPDFVHTYWEGTEVRDVESTFPQVRITGDGIDETVDVDGWEALTDENVIVVGDNFFQSVVSYNGNHSGTVKITITGMEKLVNTITPPLNLSETVPWLSTKEHIMSILGERSTASYTTNYNPEQPLPLTIDWDDFTYIPENFNDITIQGHVTPPYPTTASTEFTFTFSVPPPVFYGEKVIQGSISVESLEISPPQLIQFRVARVNNEIVVKWAGTNAFNYYDYTLKHNDIEIVHESPHSHQGSLTIPINEDMLEQLQQFTLVARDSDQVFLNVSQGIYIPENYWLADTPLRTPLLFKEKKKAKVARAESPVIIAHLKRGGSWYKS